MASNWFVRLFSGQPEPVDSLPAPVSKPGQFQPSAALIASVGAACALILAQIIPAYEGVVYVGYRDSIGVPTKCMGDTTDVVLGQTYSEADCLASLNTELLSHAKPILACTPNLKGRTYQLAAAISLAYNIGVTAYCTSTVATEFNAGQYYNGCEHFGEWNIAGGKVSPGLVTRRASETKLCETGLTK